MTKNENKTIASSIFSQQFFWNRGPLSPEGARETSLASSPTRGSLGLASLRLRLAAQAPARGPPRGCGKDMIFLLSILSHVPALAATHPLPLVFSHLDPRGRPFDLASFWKSLEFSPGRERGSPCLALQLRGQSAHGPRSPPKRCKFLQSREPIFTPVRLRAQAWPRRGCRIGLQHRFTVL